MADVKRSNPKAFETLEARLKELGGVQARAGWFESAKYEDGTPVAYIAAVQEFGASIDHPGGTPYKIGADGKAIFVSKADGAGLPVTKPHKIVIPPRPFMRPTVVRESQNWKNMLASGAKAVLKGSVTSREVMEDVAKNAAEQIARSITQVTSPALKAGTVAARLRRKSDRKTRGLLDAPLRDTFTMYDNVQGIAEGSKE